MTKLITRVSICLIFSSLFLVPIFGNGQVEIDSGYVQLKDCNLFYRIWGNGEPIVFLNGGPGLSSQGYEIYADSFSQSNRIILFDQRGTGKSKHENRVNDLSIDMSRLVMDLESLREHLGFDSWIVFGHSFGGLYAVNYTAQYSKRVKKLILSATPAVKDRLKKLQDFNFPTVEKMTNSERQYAALLREELKMSSSSMIIDRLTTALKARFYVENPAKYENVGNWFYRKERSVNYRIRYNVSPRRLKRRLKKFINPVLIIHGLGDFINLSSPMENSELFKNCETRIIEYSGHIIMIDQPEIYVRTIKNFIN